MAREVLVADAGGAIFVVPASGSIRPLATGLSTPGGISIDHDGTYLVTERFGPRLSRVTAAGTVSTIAGGPPFITPHGVAVDAGGDYLVTDDGANAVFRVTRAGIITTVHQARGRSTW